MSNSEVKRLSADGSVGHPHVRVGHRQAFIQKCLGPSDRGIFVSTVWRDTLALESRARRMRRAGEQQSAYQPIAVTRALGRIERNNAAPGMAEKL